MPDSCLPTNANRFPSAGLDASLKLLTHLLSQNHGSCLHLGAMLVGICLLFHVSCSRLLLINVRMLREQRRRTGFLYGNIRWVDLSRLRPLCHPRCGMPCQFAGKRRITGSAPKLPPPQLAEALAFLDKEPLHVDMVDEFASMLQWLMAVPALPSCSVFPMFPNQR